MEIYLSMTEHSRVQTVDGNISQYDGAQPGPDS